MTTPIGKLSGMPAALCSVSQCARVTSKKSARGMCEHHYGYWWRTGSPVKLCAGCGDPMDVRSRKYCSDVCKPRCSVENCDGPVRKRGWCASHYHQARISGADPVPFKHKWSDLTPCLNCGAVLNNPMHRRFCTDNCRVAYKLHGGPRPTSTNCVACRAFIDLTEKGKRGQRRNSSVKLCRPCKWSYAKYKMSAGELAQRDGNDCGICHQPVDMTLTRRAGGLDCPSVDHIMPRSRGGTHDPENLQLAHLRCNMLKNDRVAVESGC